MNSPVTRTTPPLRLRPYAPERDLDRCLAIWRAASEKGHPFLGAKTLEEDAKIVRAVYMPAAEITVVERDDRAIGFVALLDRTVGGLFVDPAVHRVGAGRLLIDAAFRRKGRLDVEVYEANHDARAFYSACGFIEAGRRDTDDRGRALPLIRMTLGSWALE